MEQGLTEQIPGQTGRAGDETAKGWGATGFGVLGAVAMTSCCILPLVLVSFGVTGVVAMIFPYITPYILKF